MSIEDTISKYIFLYGILSLTIGKQNKVEAFILIHEPQCEFISRRRTDGMEETKTVFTSLRNMVGHLTEDGQLQDINKNMNRTMGRLINLVKIAIQEYSTKPNTKE